MNYLSIDKCKDNYLYKLKARGFRLGVYNERTQSFYGIRYKFGDRFIDHEYHWDLNEPYGTCKPVEEIEECPFSLKGRLYNKESKWKEEEINHRIEIFEWLDLKLKSTQERND